MRRLVYLLAALSGVWVASPAWADAPTPFEWKDGDRVVLIGDALIERDQDHGYLETFLTIREHDKSITFRNLGWSGDTVHGTARARFGTEADGFQHLKEHVLALKPTVLIVGYGMTESFAGEAGLPRFKAGMNHLLDVLGETRARVVLLSPIAHEDLGRPLPDPSVHNADLRKYTAAIGAIAAERGAWFIDLFSIFELSATPSLRAIRKVPPNTDDGIHLNAVGYHKFSTRMYYVLGDARREFATVSKTTSLPRGWRVEMTKPRLAFPQQPDTGESHELVSIGALGLSGDDLPGGRYTLSIDGQTVAKEDVTVWRHTPVRCAPYPELDQSERLRQAIIAKNRLYFYRWRPQNETYLFGFRKHEQGNNAREIPLFDPLVEEKEKEIARLKVPVKHVYEFIRDGEEAK